jgi:hypothetical protein
MRSNEEATLAGDISPVNQQLRRRVVLRDLMDCLLPGAKHNHPSPFTHDESGSRRRASNIHQLKLAPNLPLYA